MSNRINQQDLQHLVDNINKATDSPMQPWTKNGSGQYKANINNYHMDWAYGGVALHRMVNDGGGITCISTIGYGTKRELYNWMIAYLAGRAASI